MSNKSRTALTSVNSLHFKVDINDWHIMSFWAVGMAI